MRAIHATAPGGPEVPVAVGIMDAWAGFHGIGLCAEGDAAYLSGTSEVLAAASEVATGEPGILVFPRLGDLRVHAGPTQAGGASVAWFCEAFGTTPEAMAAVAKAGFRSVVNNRPDGEAGPQQPTSAAIEAAAEGDAAAEPELITKGKADEDAK